MNNIRNTAMRRTCTRSPKRNTFSWACNKGTIPSYNID